MTASLRKVLLCGSLIALTISTLAPLSARAAAVEIYAAGSLRGVVGELARQAGAALNIQVKSTFGGSGSLRERIEKGARPDLLLSADMGSPQKLASLGRTVVPATAFARNRICVISRRSAGVTAANLIATLLRKDVRVRTSTPVADPGGDYAWAVFDRIDALRPGAGAILKAKAQTLMHVVPTRQAPGQSATVALFASHQIDMTLTYCSGAAALETALPELTSLEIPPRLNPHPVYGMAVLSAQPDTLKLALFLLSEKGQQIIAGQGLVPTLGPSPVAPASGAAIR